MIVIAAMSGCVSLTPWTKLKAQKYKEKGYGFKAQLPQDWYRFNQGQYFLMTKDGTLLDKIVVERKKITDKLEFTKRPYFETMTLDELADIELDNLKSYPKIISFELLANKPVKIGRFNAFSLEYTYSLAEGLKIKGVQMGFVKDKRVYRILFEAADQHYYDQVKPAFERFIETFEPI